MAKRRVRTFPVCSEEIVRCVRELLRRAYCKALIMRAVLLGRISQVTPDDVMRSIHALMVFSIQTDGIEQGSGEEQNSLHAPCAGIQALPNSEDFNGSFVMKN